MTRKYNPEIHGAEDRDSPEMIRFRAGTGDWSAFNQSGITMDEVRRAAAEWAIQLRAVDRPWLCWNVDDAWCRVQQRLVLEAGWTPVVGYDPRVGPPQIEPGSILIDFNAPFGLPTMWLHFPLEFAFLFTEHLAFWHADLLVRRAKMVRYAAQFAALPDGTMAAVWNRPTLKSTLTRFYERRYWEVLGCTTRIASLRQFEQGAGWWMRFQENPNNDEAERRRRRRWYWDSGTGPFYWDKRLGGKVVRILESDIDEGHCTSIKRKDYVRSSPINAKRNLSTELSLNNDLQRKATELGIGDLVPAVTGDQTGISIATHSG